MRVSKVCEAARCETLSSITHRPNGLHFSHREIDSRDRIEAPVIRRFNGERVVTQNAILSSHRSSVVINRTLP